MKTYTNSTGQPRNVCIRRWVDRQIPDPKTNGFVLARELASEQHLRIAPGETVKVPDEARANDLEVLDYATTAEPPPRVPPGPRNVDIADDDTVTVDLDEG